MQSINRKIITNMIISGLFLLNTTIFAHDLPKKPLNLQLPTTEFQLPKQTHYQPLLQDNQKIWTNRLPDLHQGEGLVNYQQNLQIGEWALRQINATAPLIHDAWLQQSMEQLLWQMNALVRPEAPLALVIINDRQINAFAVPSGLIGVNIGLLDKARNIDEMASVLAHEIAHISQRHFQHRDDEKNKQMLLQMLGMLAGVAVASADGDAGTVAMLGTQAISANQTASFSRNQEREADRVGMQIMAQAGYDVHAMPSFFELMNQQNPIKNNTFIPSFVLSHPLTAERLSEAKARASTYPPISQQLLQNRQYRQQLFDQLQWRSRYLSKIINKNDLIQASKTSEGAKLALIMQLIDERNYAQAQQHLQHFQTQIHNVSNPLAVIVSAKLAEKQGHYQQAIQQLTSLVELFPERRDSKLYLVDSYLAIPNQQAENAQKAVQILQPLSYQYPKDIGIWQRLQQANQRLAKTATGEMQKRYQIQVLTNRANVEFWQNQLENAMTSLDQAKKIAEQLPKNTAILANIQQQMEQVKMAHQFKLS